VRARTALAALALGLLGAACGTTGATSPTTTGAPSVPASTAAPTTAPTTTVAPTTTSTVQVLVNQSGSGQASLAQFAVSNPAWDLDWSYDCSSFGQSGNFIVDVMGSGSAADTTDSGVNQLGSSGQGVEHYYDQGTFQLVIDSECSWAVKVVE
jgi:hypothetical protein